MVFNPNNPGIPGNIFGLPYHLDEADIVILPVPWDEAVSYRSGTANGPEAILNASTQIDYSIPNVLQPWQLKVCLDEISDEIRQKSEKLRVKAEKYSNREEVNLACSEIEDWVGNKADLFLDQNKIVGCLGGDHSTPLGLINTLAKRHDNFGILQIDAHMDLRRAYEGLDYSHASIMFNALKNENISQLVQVGIRDYCEEEMEFIKSQGKVATFFDEDSKAACFNGDTWKSQVDLIINSLPDLVYITFDIDGLDPSLCPNTGTPVPGGLSFNQATFLIKELVRSGRKIIGFDLSEVCPGNDDWDANVGSRILYQLCAYTGLSQGKLKFEE